MRAVGVETISHKVISHLLVLKSNITEKLLAPKAYKVGMTEPFDIAAILILSHYEVDNIGISLQSWIRWIFIILNSFNVRHTHGGQFVLRSRNIVYEYSDFLAGICLNFITQRCFELRNSHVVKQVHSRLRSNFFSWWLGYMSTSGLRCAALLLPPPPISTLVSLTCRPVPAQKQEL